MFDVGDFFRWATGRNAVARLLIPVAALFSLVLFILGRSTFSPALLIMVAVAVLALAFILQLLNGLASGLKNKEHAGAFLRPAVFLTWGLCVAFLATIFLAILFAFFGDGRAIISGLITGIGSEIYGCDPNKISAVEFKRCILEFSR